MSRGEIVAHVWNVQPSYVSLRPPVSKTKARAKTVPWNAELTTSGARAADASVCTCKEEATVPCAAVVPLPIPLLSCCSHEHIFENEYLNVRAKCEASVFICFSYDYPALPMPHAHLLYSYILDPL